MRMVSLHTLQIHPEAKRVPSMRHSEFAEFREDIEERGVRVPLELLPGTSIILDGRCRYLAAREAKIERVPVVDAAVNGDDPVVYMIRQASKRRQLSDDQRAMLAVAELEWLTEKSKRERASKAGKAGGKSRPKDNSSGDTSSSKLSTEPRARQQAAKNNNAPERKVRQAQKVAKADPKLAEQVASGQIPLAQASRQVEREQRLRDLDQKVKEAEVQIAGHIEPSWEIVPGDVEQELIALYGRGVRPQLIFADPPYNIGIDYGDGSAGDSWPDKDFLAWCTSWLALCQAMLAPTGSLWLMINDEYADHFGLLLRQQCFHRRAWVKWYETFGVNCANNFNRCSRHLFYCVKDPRKFTFHPETVRRPSDRQVKYQDKRADPAGKILDDVWEIPRLVGNATERIPGFPTQLPLELLQRVIGATSNPGDLVLDPFSGSATTGVAAVQLGRRYVGIEKQKKFIDLSIKRLKALSVEKI